MPHHPTAQRFPRIVIEDVYPQIDCGRFSIKRVVGDVLEVWADIFMDGHDILKAALCYTLPHEEVWQEVPMQHFGNDRWRASLELKQMGKYHFTVKAWPDAFATWWRDTHLKKKAGQDISLEISEGKLLIRDVLKKTKGAKLKGLKPLSALLTAYDKKDLAEELLGEEVLALMAKYGLRDGEVAYEHVPELYVDRKRAEFSAWYEIFPRSQGTIPGKSGSFRDCEKRLPDIKKMGFDVVYLTPIHPIGITHRKGKNNALEAQPGEPGSPYAIGSEEGGHKDIHPELGTIEDFRRFVKKAKAMDMEIALDFAVQVSRDHPYIKEYSEWFSFRPDGSLKYAENPPKKYQDIANISFEGGLELWKELRTVIEFWIEQGITIFRIDNPHTKPFAFWEWLIENIREKRPDIIFLAEAFTRPKIMYHLAKLGFTQSYSYFTWRNTKQELIDYLTELTRDWPKEYFRPNFFPTTPDIFPSYLHKSGKPGFIIRLTLAATLAGNYGMLAGYELCEGEPLPGKEEYLDSEKYEFKVRDWDAPGNIKDFVTRLNRIRNENSALQQFKNLTFHAAYNDQIIFYSKKSADGKNIVFVAVNLDYSSPQEAFIDMPLDLLGVTQAQSYMLDDLLLGHSWKWQGSRQHLRLNPQTNPVAVFRVHRP